MKKRILFLVLVAFANSVFAQSGRSYWTPTVKRSGTVTNTNKEQLTAYRLFELDVAGLKSELSNASKSVQNISKSSVIISFPDADGNFTSFRISENSNMDPALAARYPDIKSYAGQGIDDPTSVIYFSVSPLGVQTMQLNANKSAVFIEPYTTDQSSYAVYRKEDKTKSLTPFECRLISNASEMINNGTALMRPNADDGTRRTYRLAMSVTGEYTAYFGGTKALALAAINNTMTRVNGVFEIDFNVHMNLIANTDVVIYTSASSDPYSAATAGANGAWNQELQTTLTNNIGSTNYDIGHLFGASGGGGNAGCIGCVCVNPTSGVPLGKGSGFTSPADAIPSGDNFDIDYVAHEMGHQFGANHTFTHSNEGSGVQNEPGSGSTIMGYAGITGSTDVQAHSDAYFHTVSIQQITNYIKTTSCQTNTATGNAIPTANAGLDYTIPKGTPFMLTGTGTDANDVNLTYCWEQMNSGTSSTTFPSVTATSGPAFRSYTPTTNATRYFPRLSTIQSGATSWTWEAVPNVARTMNFRFTVRDNHAGGPANNSDDMILTVNSTAGPFAVTAPNTAVTWTAGTAQTVTWNVAGTTANGVNTANVDILLSTDGGNTYPVTILAATTNDGTQSITVPNNPGTQNRIMVKGSGHVFFDISNANFTIVAGGPDVQAPTAPTNLTASGTTSTTTNLSWTGSTDNVGVTGYDIYKNGVFLINVAGTSYGVTGLTAGTAYAFYIQARDAAGNTSAASNTANITTLSPDTQAPTAPTNLTASGTTSTTTNLSWTASTDNVGVTGYDIYQNAAFKTTVASTSYNVTGLTASTAY
ncbi:MAG: reprolysin-like metallopeptidase, partial [Bacteroidota bacterium]